MAQELTTPIFQAGPRPVHAGLVGKLQISCNDLAPIAERLVKERPALGDAFHEERSAASDLVEGVVATMLALERCQVEARVQAEEGYEVGLNHLLLVEMLKLEQLLVNVAGAARAIQRKVPEIG